MVGVGSERFANSSKRGTKTGRHLEKWRTMLASVAVPKMQWVESKSLVKREQK